MSRPAKCTLLLIALFMAATAGAQVFRVQGGVSTLVNAQGGTVEFKAPNYDGSVGLGFYNGKLAFGAETRYLLHGYTIVAGDESVPFNLPTDVFDNSHYFSARGLGVTGTDKQSRFYALAGASSTWLGTSFFQSATSDNPVGVFFYDRRLSDTVKFFSREIFSNRQTVLEGIEYAPDKWLKTSFTGGVGSNQKYLASAIDVETQKLAFKSSYVLTGDMFRRITVTSPMSSEINKGNLQLLYKPTSLFSITVGHQNILEPVTTDGPMEQATVNQLSTDFHIERIYFGSGLFQSTAEGRKTQGLNFYGGRRIRQHIEVNANYFESKPKGGERTIILSGTVRENFSSRVSLLQLVSRTAGQTTFAFGGDYTSNRLLLRVDYQNVYLPFRPDRPFEQALAFNAAFRVAGPMQVTASSNVAPNGQLRYTFGFNTYLYRLSGMSINANSPDAFSIAKYIVQGVVRDETGQPVEGAALYIGKSPAFTDSTGRFQVRMTNHGPFKLVVAPNEFLSNQTYEFVSAPKEATAERDENATDVEIMVRKVPQRPAAERN